MQAIKIIIVVFCVIILLGTFIFHAMISFKTIMDNDTYHGYNYREVRMFFNAIDIFTLLVLGLVLKTMIKRKS